jgi:hypothetical protein
VNFARIAAPFRSTITGKLAAHSHRRSAAGYSQPAPSIPPRSHRNQQRASDSAATRPIRPNTRDRAAENPRRGGSNERGVQAYQWAWSAEVRGVGGRGRVSRRAAALRCSGREGKGWGRRTGSFDFVSARLCRDDKGGGGPCLEQ